MGRGCALARLRGKRQGQPVSASWTVWTCDSQPGKLKGSGGLILQLGVLDHLHAVLLNHFAFERNGLRRFGGEFLVYRLLVADYQVELGVRSEEADRKSG